MENTFMNMPSSSGPIIGNPKLERIRNSTTWKFDIKMSLKELEIYNMQDGSEVIQTNYWKRRLTAKRYQNPKYFGYKILEQGYESAKTNEEKLVIIYNRTLQISLHIFQ